MEGDSIAFKKAPNVESWKGILFQNSIPGSEMSWCIVEDANTSGIRIIESLPNLSHCVIKNNRSGDSGGGLKISLTIPDDLIISDCTISNNRAPSDYTVTTSHAAGIWVVTGSGTVRFVNCKIENNQTTIIDGRVEGGGGRVAGNVEFTRCTIRSNTVYGQETIPGGVSSGRGGGIYVASGRVTFVSSVINNNMAIGNAPGGIQGNQGYASGGGIHINDGQVSFLNSIIAGNTASSTHGTEGGGIFANAGQTIIKNCTIVQNNVHAIHRNQADVTVVNSIVYFNNGNAVQIAGIVSVTYSDVQGGFPGDGNINFDPILYSSTCLQIVAPSFCIDAGNSISTDNDVCFPPSLGTVRNDMGAHGGPNACIWDVGCVPTNVEDRFANIPGQFLLEQNYPNPFNPFTTIKYQLLLSNPVELAICNLLGQKVKTLVDMEQPAGTYRIQWDGKSEGGKFAPSGVYLYRLKVGSFIQIRKMILIR